MFQYGGAATGSRPGTRGASAPVVGSRGSTPAAYPRGSSAGFSRQAANPTITRTTDQHAEFSGAGITTSKMVCRVCAYHSEVSQWIES